MNIIIFGFKHCGKTSLGQAVAEKLDREFVDVDYLIENAYYLKNKRKLSFFEIYKSHGERYFRQLESEVIASLTKYDNAVIALGGGSVLLQVNVNILKRIGILVYLKVSEEVLKERIKHTETNIINKGIDFDTEFCKKYCERSRIYESVADLFVDDKRYTIQKLALELIKVLKN